MVFFSLFLHRWSPPFIYQLGIRGNSKSWGQATTGEPRKESSNAKSVDAEQVQKTTSTIVTMLHAFLLHCHICLFRILSSKMWRSNPLMAGCTGQLLCISSANWWSKYVLRSLNRVPWILLFLSTSNQPFVLFIFYRKQSNNWNLQVAYKLHIKHLYVNGGDRFSLFDIVRLQVALESIS